VRLLFILSDGRLGEREAIRRRVRALASARVLVAFVLVDAAAPGTAGGTASIFDVKRVEYVAKDGSAAGGGGARPGARLTVVPYMDGFPFDFYAVVRAVGALPDTLADGVRQWMEMVNADG